MRLKSGPDAMPWGALLLFCATASGHAVEWPQYRGGNHDGFSPDRIQTAWPETGPAEVWRVPCTNGLSSFAVSDGLALTQIRRSLKGADREVCVALNAATGDEIWSADIGPANYDSGVGNDDGPRSTPTIDGDRVYVLSSYLVLHCLDRRTGAALWRKDLPAIYGGSVITWQSAASPLLENGLMFVNCNASTNSLLALRAADGSLVWRTQKEKMTQSTPVMATIAGVRQVIFATQSALVSLDPATGAMLWRARYPFSYDTSLAASPLVYSNIVFISANYSMGSFATRIALANSTWTATPLWTNSTYKAHWMTPVVHNGYAYGLFGSSTTAALKCIDLRNGAQKWSVSGFGRGGTILAGNAIVALAERGDLVLLAPNPSAYTELARWTVFPNYNADANKCWNVPAVANGRVYARSTAEAVCLNIALPGLRLLPPVITGNGLQLSIASDDGVPLDATRLARIQLRTTSDLAAPLDRWTTLNTPMRLDAGVIRVDNLEPGTLQSFYMATEAQ